MNLTLSATERLERPPTAEDHINLTQEDVVSKLQVWVTNRISSEVPLIFEPSIHDRFGISFTDRQNTTFRLEAPLSSINKDMSRLPVVGIDQFQREPLASIDGSHTRLPIDTTRIALNMGTFFHDQLAYAMSQSSFGRNASDRLSLTFQNGHDENKKSEITTTLGRIIAP